MMKFFKKQYIQPSITPESKNEKFGCIDKCSEDGVEGWFIDLDSPCWRTYTFNKNRWYRNWSY